MKVRSKKCVAKRYVVALFVFVFITVPLAAKKAMGESHKAGNVVKIMGPSLHAMREAKKLPLKVQDALFLKDDVMTGETTVANLDLIRDAKANRHINFFLHENSHIQIEKILKHAGGKKNVYIRILKGYIEAIARGLSETKKLFIHTPNGVIGVKGSKVKCDLFLKNELLWLSLFVERGSHVFFCSSADEDEFGECTPSRQLLLDRDMTYAIDRDGNFVYEGEGDVRRDKMWGHLIDMRDPQQVLDLDAIKKRESQRPPQGYDPSGDHNKNILEQQRYKNFRDRGPDDIPAGGAGAF